MDLQTAVKGIASVRERIVDSWELPNPLSDAANKMALYNAYLGDHLGQLEYDREVTKGEKYNQYLNTGMSATGADTRSRADVAELTGKIKKFNLMHSDAANQISIIQSRLRVLESNRRNET